MILFDNIYVYSLTVACSCVVCTRASCTFKNFHLWGEQFAQHRLGNMLKLTFYSGMKNTKYLFSANFPDGAGG